MCCCSHTSVGPVSERYWSGAMSAWYWCGTSALLIPSWCGAETVPRWYRVCTAVAPHWYRAGTGLVSVWGQCGTGTAQYETGVVPVLWLATTLAPSRETRPVWCRYGVGVVPDWPQNSTGRLDRGTRRGSDAFRRRPRSPAGGLEYPRMGRGSPQLFLDAYRAFCRSSFCCCLTGLGGPGE